MPESEERLRMLYAASSLPAGGHLLEEEWERLACREMTAADRALALDHITRCAECARIWRGLDALAEGAREFDPSVPARRGRVLAFPRGLLMGGLAAAAAIALVLLRPAATPQATPAPAVDGFRGGAEGLDPTPLAPTGRVARVPTAFTFKGIAAPALYRVVILDSDGEPIWSSVETEGSVVAWPSELGLKPGSYFWQVIALPPSGIPGDRRASALAAFELVTSSRP